MEKSINTKIDSADALQNKIVSSIVDDYVDNLQTRYRAVAGESTDDVYSSVKDLGYKINDGKSFNELNHRLKRKTSKMAKARMLERMLEEYSLEQELYEKEYLKQQIEDYKLSRTANPNLMVNPEGKYFRVLDVITEEEGIKEVCADGSYIVHTQLQRTSDILVTTYNKDDKAIAIKLMKPNSDCYKTESYVARKLNLKREYVNQYKLHGYSGNASGMIATLKNMITQPLPSGCYLYENYSFYKWSIKNSQFELQLRQGTQQGSPMLADYDIKEDRVVRTDYDGAGMFI